MPKQPDMTNAVSKLRSLAEARMAGQPKNRPTKAGDKTSQGDMVRMIHELEVHQVELELQNEELLAARIKMETALEKYTDLYDFAPVGYLTLDAEGNIRESNLAASSLLGIERSALVNRRLGLFVSNADRPVFAAFLQQAFASGSREECELSLVVENKPAVDVRMEAVVFESGQACRVAVTDITAHKRAEADRLILDKLESTGILAGGLAHDFNNLLTVILLDLELAGMLTPPGEELARLLEEAKKSALAASRLTQQLISFARSGTAARKPTPLAGVIRESVAPALNGGNVKVEFSLADDLSMVDADAPQISQAIRGIVLNALEAMPQGGVLFVRAENVVVNTDEQPSLPPGEYVRLSIADQGSGIAREALPKIFDPYFSTKERGTQKGMGLGLTICHAVIKRHGGTITVTSTVGGGTTFNILLPADKGLSSGLVGNASAVSPVQSQGL